LVVIGAVTSGLLILLSPSVKDTSQMFFYRSFFSVYAFTNVHKLMFLLIKTTKQQLFEIKNI